MPNWLIPMPVCVALLGGAADDAAAATPAPPATTIATEAASTLTRFDIFLIIVVHSLRTPTTLIGQRIYSMRKRSMDVTF
jgi:hypothetical protein